MVMRKRKGGKKCGGDMKTEKFNVKIKTVKITTKVVF